jgi:Zn-finger nucleic acid-binding protein
MKCPRDGSELTTEREGSLDVDRCPQCRGLWLDHDELDELEATVAQHEHHRRATIEYAKRPSDLPCPVCHKLMRAFNYRAYNLELETCEDRHGFWLDAGEEKHLLEIMRERVRGLNRAVHAERSWHDAKRGGGRSIFARIGDMFRGGRR